VRSFADLLVVLEFARVPDEGRERPCARQPFENVFTGIAEVDPGAGTQVDDGRRHQELSICGERRDASCGVDGDAAHVVTDDFHRPDVNAGT
jgi:hypothetical protein